jgi:hypothetical protein
LTLSGVAQRLGVCAATVYRLCATGALQHTRVLNSGMGRSGPLAGEGKRVAAYGAAAKGSTLLNVFGIGRETLEFVADRST